MSRHARFWSLNIGICDLFVIWCLEFVILAKKLKDSAIYLWPGSPNRRPRAQYSSVPIFQHSNYERSEL